ncbi:MAG: molybdopterin-dependent oxidoreductase [Nitrososphaerales archaeon]
MASTSQAIRKGSASRHVPLKELKNLPKHKQPKHSTRSSNLAVLGAVANPLTISINELRSLPTAKLSEDFRCLEGWVVKDVLWEGVPVSTILKTAKLRKDAKFLLFGSGKYTCRMNLKRALRKTTMIALRKSGSSLRTSNGGPMRLISKGHDCYESVKWVDRIQVLTKARGDTARKIALSRIEILPERPPRLTDFDC